MAHLCEMYRRTIPPESSIAPLPPDIAEAQKARTAAAGPMAAPDRSTP
jgi:hypothetical protein